MVFAELCSVSNVIFFGAYLILSGYSRMWLTLCRFEYVENIKVKELLPMVNYIRAMLGCNVIKNKT